MYYVMIFALCVFFYIIHVNTKNILLKKCIEYITLIILALLSGTRYRLGGWDYEIYESIFNLAPKLSDFTINTTNNFSTEIGYIFLNSVVKSFGFNFYGFTLIHSILFYILLYKALKKYKLDFSYFIIVFLYKCCIFNTFVSMRQSLVLVIFLNAIYYLINNNVKRYLTYVIPCVLLHISSIILIPLLFVKNIDFSKKGLIIYACVFFLCLLLNLTGVYVFNPTNLILSLFSGNLKILNKTDVYLSSVEGSINILSSIETFGLLFLLILFYNKIYKSATNERKIIINLYLLTVPIVSLLRNFEIMIRFRDYFSIFFPFVIYYISQAFDKKSKLIYNILIFILCFCGFYRYIYTYDSGEYALKNYQSYLNKYISIFDDN